MLAVETPKSTTTYARALRRRLGRVFLSANLGGMLLAFVYLWVIYPGPVRGRAIYVPDVPAPYVMFGVLLVAVGAITSVWLRRTVNPLANAYALRRVSGNAEPLPDELNAGVLGLVRHTVTVTVLVWVVAAAILAFWAWAAERQTAANATKIFAGTVGVAGLFATAIVYFSTDLVWRDAIAVFFPHGRPRTTAPDGRILRRLVIVFSLVGVWPPLVLASLSLPRAHTLIGAPDAETIFVSLVALQVFVLAVSVVASLGVAYYVTRGITDPIAAMRAAMARVEQMDLAARVPATTDDELGYLGERFNQMVVGLREREHIRSMFGQYVTSQVADAVLRGQVKLGGDRKEVTMLMTDIRDFTSLAERMEPEALVSLLNRYLEGMIDAIVECGGTLDKFVGDAIVTEFNVPLPQPDHALRAVLCALHMRERLAAFNAAQVHCGEPQVRMGMGIHTGPAVVGNIGAEGKKVEYTAMGDTVNVASRLESLTKDLRNDICLSAATYAQVREYVQVSAPIEAHVKGRVEPVTVYQLLELKPGVHPGLGVAPPLTRA